MVLVSGAIVVSHQTVSCVRLAQDRLEACPTGTGVAGLRFATAWLRMSPTMPPVQISVQHDSEPV